MFATIEEIKPRLMTVNQIRIYRALSVMKPAYQRVCLLLPLYLHYNHPSLIGYLSEEDAPHGITLYQPNQEQRSYLEELSDISGVPTNWETLSATPAISGVYSMGSSSSIGQSVNSDLDIWICYSPNLDIRLIELLQKKCSLIEQWAHSLDVDISLFLMSENHFRLQENRNVDAENCGSTQHITLLDEFYRTFMHLAGKWVVWSLVPVEEELKNYDGYVEKLYKSQQITRDEWLDFGGLGEVSADEYFGASLWQLYKSIDSPYKAVLKTLLLEAYSWEYPQNRWLALEVKQRLQDGEFLNVNVDAYCIMLERVSDYLNKTHDSRRLDLVRRCFYLKSSELLSQSINHSNWRHEILHALIQEWQWEQKDLELLDRRMAWKFKEVESIYNELLDVLMVSYRNLIRFARKNHLSMSANPQDISILTRKLYAAFEVLPGKITRVNLQLSADMSEEHLTVIRVEPNHSNPSGWYLYNRPPLVSQIGSNQLLQHHTTVSKLIAWSHFNGLLTESTTLYVKCKDPFMQGKLEGLKKDIALCFPVEPYISTRKELCNPSEIRKLTVIVNLEFDPTTVLNEEIPTNGNIDIFNYGKEQHCLVGSLDILYQNSWGELCTLHSSGEQSLLNGLKSILGKMHQDAQPPESIQVLCYSQQLTKLIQQRLQHFFDKAIKTWLSQRQGYFTPVRMSGQTWGIFFERFGISIFKLENGIEFYEAISNNKLHRPALSHQYGGIELPEIIYRVASKGIIQYFFEDVDDDFTIYILDDLNRVDVYQHCGGCKIDFVQKVSHFYSSSHERYTYDPKSVMFNLPQFYQIVTVNGQKQVEVFSQENGNRAQQRLLNAQ